MNKIHIYIIIFVMAFTCKSYSQGFDWQYDIRLPFNYPEYFITFSANYGFDNHTGNFDFLENGISCCSFESGSGNIYNLNAGIEYWYRGDIALIGEIGYSSLSGNFANRTSVPRTEDYILITEYQYDAQFSNLSVNLGGKYRLNNSKFFGGVLLNTKIITNQDNNFREIKISPVTDPFRDRDIPAGEIQGLRRILLDIQFLVGYDINLGKSKYLSVYLKFNQQINSMVDENQWYRRSLITGIKFNKGLIFKN